MIEQLTTDPNFWQPIMPYIGGIIIALCAFVATILYAAGRWIKAGAEKEIISARKEETYLGLVNDLRVEVAQLKEHVRQLQTCEAERDGQIHQLQERETEREKVMAALTQERDALKKELERIAAELEGLRKEIQRLIDERNALNNKLEQERQLRQEAEIKRTQVESALDIERTRLNAEIALLQGKVATLEERIELINHSKEQGS